MKALSRRSFVALSSGAALMPLGRYARGNDWPNRFVRMIVPFPPGGGTDAVGRIVAVRLSELWGQQVVIENRGGAGSNIGAEAAAHAPPDGYTLFFAALPLAINRFIYPTLNYDPIEDFAPVSLLCTYPNVLAVPNSSPAKSVADLIAYAKQKPGGLYFGSSGIGTSPHLCGELFKRMANIPMTHVPYRGAGPAMTDLMTGRIDMMFNTIGALLTHVRAGQLRGLAVSSIARVPTAPELPTVAEMGVPGFDVSSWYALFVPANTSPDIILRMNLDTAEALADPGVREKLDGLGVVVASSKPSELAALMKSEMEKWGPIIKSAGISVQ
jgi:tripartite-type tricarboxylate transporter receptor subunit TctC